MSDTPIALSTILAALGTNVAGKLTRAANRRSVALSILAKKPAIGKNITWDVNTSGAVAESFSDADAVSNFGSDAIIQPSLSWATRRSNYRIGDVAMRVARAQGGNPEWALALDEKALGDAITALCADANSQIFTGTGGSPSFAGFGDALASTSNTYAGIDRSQAANALFRPNVIDPGAPTPITLDQIRQDVGDTIYTACGAQPDLAFCHPTTFYKVAALFSELMRYNRDVNTLNLQDGRQVVLDAGVGTIVVEGVTFVKDKDCPAGRIYYVNSQEVWIEYLPAEGLESIPVEAFDGYDNIMLSMAMSRLGKRSASTDLTVDLVANLVCRKPSACGVRLNVA